MKTATAFLSFVAGALGAIAAASAESPDMRLGTFDSVEWCSYAATLYVDSQEPNSWVFHGRILIEATGQIDPIWMEQYADNSLRVIRYLQGRNTGLTQVLQSYPPQEQILAGTPSIVFSSKNVYGEGCSDSNYTAIILP